MKQPGLKMRSIFAGAVALLLIQNSPAVAANAASPSGNVEAIIIFFAFLLFTLAITWFAAKRTKDREAFLVASGGISPFQNGLAIAGDFMSAATFLGITGLMFFVGYDAYILSFSIIIGWPLMLMLIAERLRNLGRFTFVDALTFRLEGRGIRILSSFASLAVVMLYLIGQMVGAGKLVELLFGIDYPAAVLTVSVIIMIYIIFGGMLATTWVQMLKAVLLMVGGLCLTFLLLQSFEYDFSAMLKATTEIHPRKELFLAPGGWLHRDPANVVTVALTMCFGIMGLPHILMRFFTVKNAASARNSVAIATVTMAMFYLMILVIGIGAVAIIWDQAEYYDASGALIGGGNLVALHTARAIGGNLLFGFMAAVTFATILAVVAGLVLAGAASIAHDIYATLILRGSENKKKEFTVSRGATLVIGAIAAGLGIMFEHQNIAVVTSIALALAASVNFPLLLLSMYWKGLTSQGAILGGGIASILCFAFIILGDNVWVQLLGNDKAIFPYIYPTVITMPAAFGLAWLFSVLDRSERGMRERVRFDEQFVRAETGIGAHGAQSH